MRDYAPPRLTLGPWRVSWPALLVLLGGLCAVVGLFLPWVTTNPEPGWRDLTATSNPQDVNGCFFVWGLYLIDAALVVDGVLLVAWRRRLSGGLTITLAIFGICAAIPVALFLRLSYIDVASHLHPGWGLGIGLTLLGYALAIGGRLWADSRATAREPAAPAADG